MEQNYRAVARGARRPKEQAMQRKAPDTADSRRKLTVLIVDDHPIVRQGLAQLINQEDDLEVCGQAQDAHEALQAIRKLDPDMVITDISLKDTSGIDLIGTSNPVPEPARARCRCTMRRSTASAASCPGHIMKQEATEKVVTVRRVLAGESRPGGMAAKWSARSSAEEPADWLGGRTPQRS
jgi:DNA-binding NarL/FixJ family response regulator